MKKGFTLIELLAVIVILAIIAVIAVPIVLNIIDESKKNATLRSADFYLDSVEYAIANRVLDNKSIDDGEYKILKSGNICLAYDADNKCVDELVVDMKGEKPTSGTVIIEKGQIVGNSSNDTEKKTTMTIGTNTIVYNTTEKEYVIEETEVKEDVKTLSSICTPSEEQKYTTNPLEAGYKYDCDVDSTKKGYDHSFYVLTTLEENEESVDLIMDRNICDDGTPATSTNVCAVSTENVKAHMPQEALKYLYNATKLWDNVPPLTYTYMDSDYYGGYESFISVNGLATIKGLDFDNSLLEIKIGTSTEPLRARMPVYKYNSSTRESFGEVAETTANNKFLYENFSCDDYTAEDGPDYCIDDTDYIDNIWSYYTMSTTGGDPFAWIISHAGLEAGGIVNGEWKTGVRPVITLKI